MIWVEPCAGAAACALYLVGGRSLVPPVSWMGGKRRLAPLIVEALVGHDRPDRLVLADASTWGWVWPVLLGPEGPRVAAILRGWQTARTDWSVGDARELWTWLASQPPSGDPAWDAAQWLWLQARAASGVPVWHTGQRFEQADHDTGRTVAAGQTGDPAWQMGKTEGRTASQPVEQKGWRMGEELKKARRGDQPGSDDGRPAGQRGLWQMGNERGGTKPAKEKGTNRAGAGGIVRPATVADRLDAVRAAGWSSSRAGPGGGPGIYQGGGNEPWRHPSTMGDRLDRIHASTDRVIALHVRAEDLDLLEIGDPTEMVVYLDPPYAGATGYEAAFPRDAVLAFALRCLELGAVVGVSESEPLDLPGWHHLDLTPHGTGKAEWLTLSRPPVITPAVQGKLFG